MKTIFTKYQLPLFFLLSYLLSWWFMLLAPGQLAHGVTFATAIVIALAAARTGLREWWGRVTNFRAGRWFLVGFAIIIGCRLAAFAINLLMGAMVVNCLNSLGTHYYVKADANGKAVAHAISAAADVVKIAGIPLSTTTADGQFLLVKIL